MTIEFKPENYFHGVWFQEADTFNFMGALFKEQGSTEWVFRWRMRYFRDNKVHDSADVKHWHEMRTKAPMTEAEAAAKLAPLLKEIATIGRAAYGAKPMDFVAISGPGDEEAMKKLTAKPWAMAGERMTKAEYEKKYGTTTH